MAASKRGFRVVLKDTKTIWPAGATPYFKAEVRNESADDLLCDLRLWRIELDGTWYGMFFGGADLIEAGQTWTNDMLELPMPPASGKHVVRLAAFAVRDVREAGQTMLAVSEPMEVEVAASIVLQEKPRLNGKWNYGPLTNGLRAALEVEENQEVTGGQPIALRPHIRNESNRDIQMYTTAPFATDHGELNVSDETGRSLPVTASVCLGWSSIRRLIINPGGNQAVEGPGLAFLAAQGDAERANLPCGYSIDVTPGNLYSSIWPETRGYEQSTRRTTRLAWNLGDRAGKGEVKAHTTKEK